MYERRKTEQLKIHTDLKLYGAMPDFLVYRNFYDVLMVYYSCGNAA